MNKKEILEIRKRFTSTNCCITRISTCYVTSEKTIALQKTQPFLSLPEEETFKYYDIFRKALSGKKGKVLYDIGFPSVEGGSEEENFLYQICSSKLVDQELLDEFFQKIIDSYYIAENYLIILIHGLYDIPSRSHDGYTLEDASDDVYEHVLCCICPVSLSKPGLSINSEKGEIEDRIRDWVVEQPVDGFLYPAFNDRSTDIHELLYYTKKNSQPDFLNVIAGKTEPPLSNSDELALVSNVLYNATNGQISYDTVQNFHSNVLDIIRDNEDCTYTSPDKIGFLLEKSGLKEECSELFVEDCKRELGNAKGLRLESLVDKKKITISTQTANIKVDAERADDIKTRTIDGRICLVIPLDENVVDVNGIVAQVVRHEDPTY